MIEKMTEDAVRDKAREILGFKNRDGVRTGVGQLTTFNQLGFVGVLDKPDGWYLPDNHAETAIILETKASNVKLGAKQIEEIKKNIKIVQQQYDNVVGILYNGDDTKVFRGESEFKCEGANNLQNLEYYIALFNKEKIATVYKGNIIKNLIMDCQSYTMYRPNETTGGIFVSWRRKEELPTGA